MEGNLFYIRLTQEETPLLEGRLSGTLTETITRPGPVDAEVEVTYHILYDRRRGIAVLLPSLYELAEAGPNTRLSELPKPVGSLFDFDALDSEGLEKYLSGEIKPGNRKEDLAEGRTVQIPYITGFEAQELVGEQYKTLSEALVSLYNAHMQLRRRVESMKAACLSTDLITTRRKRAVSD